jgi:DNA-directed RNA polymerase specialized sigma24 family protein
VHEARLLLGDLEHEADDVVQDLFVAMLEGRIRAPRGRGEALAHLLRLTGVFARRHARRVRELRDLE